VRSRLQARLQAKQKEKISHQATLPEPAAQPFDPGEDFSYPEPQAHRTPARPALRASRPSGIGIFRFLMFAMTLFNFFPVVGAGIPFPIPSPPDFNAGATGPGTPAALENHVQYVAKQKSNFNQTLARALPGNPGAAAAPPAAASPGPAAQTFLSQALTLAESSSVPSGAGTSLGTVATLSSRLGLLQQLVAQELEHAGSQTGAPPPLMMALNAQLAAFEGLSAGMQMAVAGYLTQAVDPAVATGLVKLASDTLLNVVNSFRVAAQSQILSTYGPELEQIHAEMNQTRGRLLVGPATAQEPASPAEREKACCDYANLMGQYLIQQVQGAAGATNVAAYTVATEAAAELVAGDELNPGNTTLSAPARGLLAATDLTAVTAVALASTVLVPPPGAAPPASFPGAGIVLDPAVWGPANVSLASRCGDAPCDLPVTRARAQAAGVTLAGSTMNLIGYSLFSVSVQLMLAMEPRNATIAPFPGAVPDLGNQTAWSDALMQNFQYQAMGTLPVSFASLLAAVPGPSGTGASAFPRITPGMGDPEVLQSVLQVVGQSIEDEYLPTLGSLDSSSVPPWSGLSGILSGLYQLASAGLEQRGLAAGGSQSAASGSQWQSYSSLVSYAKYALAATSGYRAGTLDRASASALLKDIADTLQLMVYGFLLEASAVPLEVATLYEQGAIGPLTRARAKALGLDGQARRQRRECRDCCRLAELTNQETTWGIAQSATRTYLAAYTEALIGSIISEVLDGAALARNGTTGAQAESVDAGASGEVQAAIQALGPTGPAPAQAPGQVVSLAPAQASLGAVQALARTLAQAAPPPRTAGNLPTLGTLLATGPGARLAAACAGCPCDLSFSRQQTQLALETRSGADLTLTAYTLNLVVRAFRIVLAAAP
jgi:hypothetical protein